jgi:hypothetical protein
MSERGQCAFAEQSAIEDLGDEHVGRTRQIDTDLQLRGVCLYNANPMSKTALRYHETRSGSNERLRLTCDNQLGTLLCGKQREQASAGSDVEHDVARADGARDRRSIRLITGTVVHHCKVPARHHLSNGAVHPSRARVLVRQ